MRGDRYEREEAHSQPSGSADIIYLVDRLEELVSIGKRVPFSARVMVEEEEFLGLVDQLRVAVPNEIKQAQRVIKERERIIGEAQEEARRIVQRAEDRAQILVAETSVLAEARIHADDLLRQAEEERARTRGEMDVYILEQLRLVEDAVRRGMAIMEDAVEQTIDTLGKAQNAIADDIEPPRR
jgi:vacuolar-type H+-ATPase subunit H